MQFPRRKANKNKEPSQYSTCCISYSLSDSLVFFRWRRLISPRMAALINCPVLSPSSFTFSMPSIISWAIRAVTDCDFAFFGPVAMSNPSCFWCKTIYTKKNYFKGLTCKTLLFYVVSYTLSVQGSETAKPVGAANTHRLLTTNDSNSIEAAMRNHTIHPQGRDSHDLNKYIWRFIALSTAQPRVITIEATSEQEACRKNQLIAITSQSYDLSAPAKSGAGIGVLEITRAHNTRLACFFVPHSHTLSMVGCTGAEKSAPGSLVSGYANPVQSTTSEIGVSCGGYYQSTREAANMATTPTLVHSQTAFIWRFIIFGASESQIIHVTAWTESEARNRCPSGCVAVFAARIRQGSHHA
ncbi:TPA: host cell division inhibitor Icd-like protein [Escherichia coli]|nr:host cell division inhibitor Icd-like protein [Escherichia coli]HAJ7164896.1 host cell division inhibitor Icd-like protein [Escherichia coli]HAJ7170124.1 host cell division inhibitor Icd-like protein [Escherichia coli]HAJ7199305.1 host cell division inhibitor Icd-like protein [Escherichia coli]